MLILTTFLTSCAGVKTLEIFKKEVPRENLNLEKPTPLELENLKWIIITRSHRLTYKESIQNKHIQFNTNIGDAIIFDGRIFHRGRANNSEEDRPVIYNMIHRNWYTETG